MAVKVNGANGLPDRQRVYQLGVDVLNSGLLGPVEAAVEHTAELLAHEHFRTSLESPPRLNA